MPAALNGNSMNNCIDPITLSLTEQSDSLPHTHSPLITVNVSPNTHSDCTQHSSSKLNFRKKYIPSYARKHKHRFNRSMKKTNQNNLDNDKYITNLSSKTLTNAQNRILTKGLTYIPSSRIKQNTIDNALTQFERSNRIKFFFRNSEPQEPHPFKPKSSWVPPKSSPIVEQYLERVHKEISMMPAVYSYNNLNSEERKALKELATDNSLIIKNADKGSGIVVEDRDNYIKDGLDHLADTSIYEQIDTDPTLQLSVAINKYVEQMYNKGIIDDITKDYLIMKFTCYTPRTQQLYFLKKIHKNPIAVRPIVSGCSGPTEKISQFIDMHLQPHVPLIQSYVKDSGDLIKTLENLNLPKNCTLATIDVKALYLNIPHEEGIKSVLDRLYYKNLNANDVQIPPNTMSDLLKIVLTKNYFQFNESMYHQIQGTAMGTKMAPAYANIFMAELEEQLLDSYTTKPILWKRYIDDILCIWPGPPEDLANFIRYLNEAHPTIKFTHECSKKSVDFLDITIYKGERFNTSNVLDVKPFFKKTNKFQYLEFTSAHPKQTFKSLIKGELTRLLRACSDEYEYTKIIEKMYRAFRDRGYPSRLINNVIKTVPFSLRQLILDSHNKDQCIYDTFMVMEYTPDLNINFIRNSIRPQASEEEHVPKPCLSLKRSKNLRQTLVRAKLKGCSDPIQSEDRITIPVTADLEGHSASCGNTHCKCCKLMSKKSRIISSYNHKSFPTPKYTNCNSRNVIYLLECTKCRKGNQYVGQTTRCINVRLGGHRAASRIKTNLPLYKHFTTKPDHNMEKDIKITILERTTATALTSRESHWINKLQTVYPKGLNSRYE